MTMTAVSFGSYVTAADVRNALQATIARWSRTYLDEMARHDGQPAVTNAMPTFPDFRSYVDSIDPSRWVEDQLPSCILVVPGTARKPEKSGRGSITAPWNVGVSVVVGAPDRSRTVRLAELYTSAVRMILVQKPSLGGFASRTEWVGERYTDPANVSAERTIVAGMLQFEVIVDGVADRAQGPAQPIDDGTAPTGWPTVATPDLAITPYPTDQEIPR